jgi:hypothetical protein
VFKKQEYLTAKCAKGLCKERKVFNLMYFFFATFAKNLGVFAVKNFLNIFKKK